ncbi:hypothetical protein PNOK_0435100 [Pyrrhoderma noxium]|uniref:Uncharacterized protein n=1 Tax=Pyrrhoderma noxium TaxID=2282107 RepID=A0A286UIK9_9AGAM|nr:hypothetical protein PNOK_0435100 [Pyrrhoderma noxium]
MNHRPILDLLIISCFLLNLVLFCIRIYANLHPLSSLTSIFPKDSYPYSYTGDDYPEHLPLSPLTPPRTQIRTFNLSPSNFPIEGQGADVQWNSMFPPGYGQQTAMYCTYEKILGVEHQQHCLNYLRQTTLCRADLTLERMDEMEISDFSASILRVALEPREDGYADFRESLDLSTASGRNTVEVELERHISF